MIRPATPNRETGLMMCSPVKPPAPWALPFAGPFPGVSAAASSGDAGQGMGALRHPCRFCARLTETAECPECRQHHDTYGHFPPEVHWRQVPGQPRVVSRFCGDCGRELSLPTTP